MKENPEGAIISITSQCNSKCLACDIWKKKGLFIKPKIVKKLPQRLRDIDLTGGEPFLHPNLVEIVRILKNTCPKARILITTNGLLPEKIKKIMPALLRIDKNLAVRVSLDGMGEVHDKMRGINGAFKKAIESLKFLRQSGTKDLGIIFTLTRINKDEVKKILNFCREEKLNFSLNLVYDSPIYFGKGHLKLRPRQKIIEEKLQQTTNFFLPSFNPKNWAKAWFYQKLTDYSRTGKRPLKCGAGENFFYLSPRGKVYLCYLKDWLIGDLNRQLFREIWQGKKKREFLKMAQKCHDCWMICTVKEQINKNKMKIISQLFYLDK